MGLLTDIYNTVAKFFRPQEVLTEGDASKSVAQNRLKLVLMQDRTNLTPRVLEQMRGEMIELLSKYLEMDKELLELNFEQEGDQVALMLSIPVIRAKDEEEIEAALNEEKKAEDESEDSEDDSEDETEEAEEQEGEGVAEETAEEAPKPKKKRSKKTAKTEDNSENEEKAEEEQITEASEEVNCENVEA